MGAPNIADPPKVANLAKGMSDASAGVQSVHLAGAREPIGRMGRVVCSHGVLTGEPSVTQELNLELINLART
jgi:hypothetical protein